MTDLPPEIQEQIRQQEKLGVELAILMVKALPENTEYTPLAFASMIQSVVFALIATSPLTDKHKESLRVGLHHAVHKGLDDAFNHIANKARTAAENSDQEQTP